ncbi:amiloride-sensitive sodium channel subunit beta [Brachionus plicatilis]|uniref:Amiloride-sensitive sodium channel subunit beta n=1 Tax=Brachionus plicatilis TaxID=10195 RepID=A0A3M7S424_BRAPC|nr:amiloride-sensitive sodium channel subunit beta [Brachionus plicatilis]
MLIFCQYDEKECNVDDFVLLKSQLFGNCYTFNSGRNSSGHKIPIRKKSRPEIIKGLKMELFIGAPEYHPCWELRYGALVSVHNQSSIPMITMDGMMVQTGSETNLILNKVNMKKLSKPYSNCVVNLTNKNEIDSVHYRNTFNYIAEYRQNWCLLNCSINTTTEENIKKCSSLNFTTEFEKKSCINNFEDELKHVEFCSSQCPIECDHSYFTMFNSVATFPTISYASYLLLDESFRSKFPYENISMNQVKESVLSFNVYFNTDFNQMIEEVPELDGLSLLGNLGGQLGLFLGVSVLTFAEIFEIIFELSILIFNTKVKNRISEQPSQ